MAELELKFVDATALRKGGYVLIDGAVCRIVENELSKPGKHGAMKVRVTGLDAFTGQKKQLLSPGGAEVEVPVIDKSDAQVVAIMGTTLQMMDVKTYETFELPMPEEFKSELTAGVEVEYQRAGNLVSITRIKSSK